MKIMSNYGIYGLSQITGVLIIRSTVTVGTQTPAPAFRWTLEYQNSLTNYTFKVD
jgi:hypothetical protein